MISDGTIGEPVSALVSRQSRAVSAEDQGRVKLSPAAMESTHDLDFVLWCLRRQAGPRLLAGRIRREARTDAADDIPDLQWLTVTMDIGLILLVGGGWSLPPGYPNFSIDMDRDDRHRRRADGRRHPPTSCSTR